MKEIETVYLDELYKYYRRGYEDGKEDLKDDIEDAITQATSDRIFYRIQEQYVKDLKREVAILKQRLKWSKQDNRRDKQRLKAKLARMERGMF